MNFSAKNISKLLVWYYIHTKLLQLDHFNCISFVIDYKGLNC